MATVNEKMGALANEIRELSGTTSIKTIDNMTNDVAQANEKILDQAELINQIYTALEGKAGSSGTQLPTLTNPASASDILSGKEAIDGSGNKITGTIATKTSSNLTASGATITVPAGYYAGNATKSVATATQATPTISVDSAGKITASAIQTAGYVSAGTKTATKQLTTQVARTVTPTTSSQIAVPPSVYTTGAVTVAAIPSNYEDVGAETTEYTSLNAELEAVINSLPSAGGGSGGNVETCTIMVSGYYGQTDVAIYTAYSNGSFSSVTEGNAAINFDGTLENVVCGSAVVFPGNYVDCSCTDGEVFFRSPRGVYYTAPLIGNTVATIVLVQD